MKRHEALQPLSREHHHNLLLCWKIRRGFSKGIEPARIKKYANWFFERYITPHFNSEEKYIFPILGMNHAMTKKAVADHRRLRRLFDDKEDIEKSLGQIEEELERHVRFEERILFNEIQESATKKQLEAINKLHYEHPFVENTEDEFWR